jgi:type II secretory pathway pseudopilin PulG
MDFNDWFTMLALIVSIAAFAFVSYLHGRRVQKSKDTQAVMKSFYQMLNEYRSEVDIQILVDIASRVTFHLAEGEPAPIELVTASRAKTFGHGEPVTDAGHGKEDGSHGDG